MRVLSGVAMDASAATEIGEILEHYQIGELAGYEPLDRGYVNVSYSIETVAEAQSADPFAYETTRYFFRRYRKGITEQEVRFEHSLISHLVEQGFDLVAALIPTVDGKTYVKRVEQEAVGVGVPVFYALFEFLPGEDRYTWDKPACTDDDLKRAAAVLGDYHRAVYGLEPEGQRVEPKIHGLLPLMAERLERHLAESGDNVFDAYLRQHAELVQEEIEGTLQAIRHRGCSEMTQLVIHCDYHPGNLKFEDSEVTGLFDFDWSKIDARGFDVGLALVYFCTAWEPERSGEFDLSVASAFLHAYQNALAGLPGPGPLDDAELECLPHMIAAGNLYVLNWALEDFYAEDVDAEEYRRYLRHHVRLIDWLRDDDNWHRLTSLIAATGPTAISLP